MHNLECEDYELISPRVDPPKGFGQDGRPLPTPSPNKNQAIVTSSVLMPARKPTAYSLFANQERKFVIKLNSKELQKHMGKYFSMRWKTMDFEEKQLYEMLEKTGSKTV